MFSGDRPDFQSGQLGQVRSLQIQMEGLEQAQGELLQQLRKAGANRSHHCFTNDQGVNFAEPSKFSWNRDWWKPMNLHEFTISVRDSHSFSSYFWVQYLGLAGVLTCDPRTEHLRNHGRPMVESCPCGTRLGTGPTAAPCEAESRFVESLEKQVAVHQDGANRGKKQRKWVRKHGLVEYLQIFWDHLWDV